MSGGDRQRAFIALVIDAVARDRLSRLSEELRLACPEARWVGGDKLHLTLRFLGELDRASIDDLACRLREAASRCHAARVALGPLGMFPARGAPRVLWVGVALTRELLALQETCEGAAVAIGLSPERNPYRSHVTLARWRGRVRRPELPEVDVGQASLTKIVLFESELGPSGAVHTPLVEHELRAEVA